jgi:phosphate transport system substrate-binding protein
MRRDRVALLLAATVVLGGCSTSDRGTVEAKAPAGGVLLKGAGATFPSLLYQRWFTLYQDSHRGAAIAYDAVGSGEGIRRFTGTNVKPEEAVDFGASDAAMSDEQMAHVPQGVLLLPVTAGSVVLAYNLPGFQGELRLSRKAVAGIFLGEIKSWNDRSIAAANPGTKLPRLTIATVVRLDGSGTTYAFTKHLDAISETWRSRYGAATLVNWPGNAMRAKGNEGVAGLIRNSNGSIGYVGYEFARKIGLPIATLENKDGNFVRPSAQSATAALASAELPDNLRVFVPDPSGRDSYPIVTMTWILLRKDYADAAKARAIRDLFEWCLRDGQKYAPELNYIPLPPEVIARALPALATIKPE